MSAFSLITTHFHLNSHSLLYWKNRLFEYAVQMASEKTVSWTIEYPQVFNTKKKAPLNQCLAKLSGLFFFYFILLIVPWRINFVCYFQAVPQFSFARNRNTKKHFVKAKMAIFVDAISFFWLSFNTALLQLNSAALWSHYFVLFVSVRLMFSGGIQITPKEALSSRLPLL